MFFYTHLYIKKKLHSEKKIFYTYLTPIYLEQTIQFYGQ